LGTLTYLTVSGGKAGGSGFIKEVWIFFNFSENPHSSKAPASLKKEAPD